MAASPRLEDVTGSSLEAEFGGTGGGVRESPIAQATGSAAAPTGAQSAPANASAAPGKTKDVFTGLCEALNTFQRRLADPKDPNRKYDVPDEYEIEFSPTTLASATLKRQGTTDKSKTPLQQPSPSALKPATNSVNTKASIMPVSAGMQIVQFIDQIMRNSSYITDQQLYIVDPVLDPVTGEQKIKPNPNPTGGTVAWYKVSVEATQLAYDARRHDHAYRMKYVITPYAINSLPSDWFKNSRYRGSHKSYNYWFTGANKEILNFEQEYNNLYRLVISGLSVPVQQARTDFRDQYRRTFLPASENHAKGADGNTNEPGDNAASFLYSPTDQAKAKLRIVGDPAWMQQGEVAGGVSARNFNFDPFNNDGTINYDSQEVVFDISWNQPADYDLDTGLMDLKRTGIKPDGTYSTQPQLNFTYTAIKCKNIFSKGRFEQDIEGRLLIEFEKNPASADAGRPSSNAPTTANGTRNNTNGSANDWVDVNGLQVLKSDVTADGDSNQSDSAPQLLNSPPPAAPTSDGDIVPTTSVPSPSTADIANSPNDGVKEKLALAASYEERAAAARAAGELSNAATLARLAQNSRENAAADAKFGAPPVISNPQKTNRET
jgi:hypothetical protein